MARKCYVQIGLELVDKDDHEALARARGEHRALSYTIMPDLPDFISPIDGRRYSGRAGLREHCAAHNVVPVSDLAGLPPAPAYQIPTYTKREVEARKANLARIVDQYWR